MKTCSKNTQCSLPTKTEKMKHNWASSEHESNDEDEPLILIKADGSPLMHIVHTHSKQPRIDNPRRRYPILHTQVGSGTGGPAEELEAARSAGGLGGGGRPTASKRASYRMWSGGGAGGGVGPNK
jgi:hypothetical protein